MIGMMYTVYIVKSLSETEYRYTQFHYKGMNKQPFYGSLI